MMSIRAVQESDRESWERMRQKLWPSAPGEHAKDIDRFFSGHASEPLAVLLALNEDKTAIGFIELSIRAYAEGCATDRVAFIEGWYIEEDSRRKGVGAALIAAAEEWARSLNCAELASDTDVDNVESAAAHRAVGFVETAVIRCFKKNL